MNWRLAKSLIEFRDEVNAHWPNRSKNSDGTIGDENHSSRSSDHNPDDHGIVCAIDITHDPRNGLDSYKLADAVLASQDPRLKYVISNGRIGSGPRGTRPGQWRKYTGLNRHDHHCHISVVDNEPWVDSHADWAAIPGVPNAPVADAPVAPPYLVLGSRGDDIVKLQRLLGIDDDGWFGPDTEKAVIATQRKAKIVVDGKCGPQTWKALGGYPISIIPIKKLVKKVKVTPKRKRK